MEPETVDLLEVTLVCVRINQKCFRQKTPDLPVWCFDIQGVFFNCMRGCFEESKSKKKCRRKGIVTLVSLFMCIFYVFANCRPAGLRVAFVGLQEGQVEGRGGIHLHLWTRGSG